MEPVRPEPGRPEPGRFSRVVIIGHGLIGGSIALAAAERLPKVRIRALDRNDDISAAADADLVVIAAPIGEILKLVPALARVVPTTTLITDTGSTKAAIVQAAAGLRFIGGHPIAGTAVSGRPAARADLFAGRPWVLTPSSVSDPTDVARLQHFVESLGARAEVLAAEEHDRLFAFLSHLPQLVVSALMDVVGSHVGEDALAMAGPGLRDSTRLATSPPDIWLDVVNTNEAAVHRALDRLIERLTAIRDDRSGASLARTFESAARWRMELAKTTNYQLPNANGDDRP